MTRAGASLVLAGSALVSIALGAGASALAEITPHAGDGDPHIQSVEFDPQQVVGLHVASGYAVTLVFAADERIETVTLGDSGGWQVTVDHRADHLVVKPLGSPSPTNLTVLSDQRSYNFTLYGAGPGEGVQPYLVSFTYPAAPADPVSVVPSPPVGTYTLRGDRTIWPTAMSDDGTATAIRWAGNRTIPAVYLEDRRGQLALVNGLMQAGNYVIEGVHGRLVFVLGRARATASRIVARP